MNTTNDNVSAGAAAAAGSNAEAPKPEAANGAAPMDTDAPADQVLWNADPNLRCHEIGKISHAARASCAECNVTVVMQPC